VGEGGRVSNPIRDANDEFHGRIPVEGLVETLRAEIAQIRTELLEELLEARQWARREKEELMATLADDQAADKRYQDAVAVRDAREKATITSQASEITTQEATISTLKAGEVPDDVVQAKNDLAAQIEAENKAAEAAPTGGQGAGSGATV